jgi:hypothetical protein
MNTEDLIWGLFIQARDTAPAPEIDEDQRRAVNDLIVFAKGGEHDAMDALKRLSTAPRVHPVLKEKISTVIRGI